MLNKKIVVAAAFSALLIAGSASAASTSTATSTASSTPNAPRSLVAQALVGKVKLNWLAPLMATNSSPIKDYIVEYKQVNGTSTASSTWIVFNDGVSASTTATVNKLVSGGWYWFRVKAINMLNISGSYSNIATSTAK